MARKAHLWLALILYAVTISVALAECKTPQSLADEEITVLKDYESREAGLFKGFADRGLSDDEISAAVGEFEAQRSAARKIVTDKMLDYLAKCEAGNDDN